MILEDTFPLRFVINLGDREDRRVLTERELSLAGISAERLPAVRASWLKSERGHESKGRYALALTQRIALRKARQRNAPAVLLFEDDLMLSPQLRQLLEQVDLPDDWGMFYLGGAHLQPPKFVSPYLVRCRYIIDTHAVAFRAKYYDQIMAALKGNSRLPAGSIEASDRLLANLQDEIPTYAVSPNLAWQDLTHSDLLGDFVSNYSRFGNHLGDWARVNVRGLSIQNLGGTPYEPPIERTELTTTVRPCFLFLTRGELNLPKVWEEYFTTCNSDYSIVMHAKDPEAVSHPLWKSTSLTPPTPTAWADVSLVRATIRLLTAGLQNPNNTHFILLSESCAPIKPLDHLIRFLSIEERSLMGWREVEEVFQENPKQFARSSACPSIPVNELIFHAQWMMLGREAAEIVCEEDFTDHFEGFFAPDELYFATLLNMKGYPMENIRNLCPTDVRWEDKEVTNPMMHDEISPELAGEFANSPHFFARKFSPESNLAEFGLHLNDGLLNRDS